MVRWKTVAAAVVIVIVAAFVSAAATPPKSSDSPDKRESLKAIAVTSQKIGFFNMAKVGRECKHAQTLVQRLNARKESMNQNLNGMREMYKELQNAPTTNESTTQERLAREKLMLSRRIEDMDREINKLVNNQASTIVAELYDEIYASTVEIARERGLTVVFSYPDAATPEERDSPYVKELKLKPPAAQPFFLDPSADYTEELIERLNAKF
jgi:Skp family chaperone for outer membrane proteins